MLRPDRRPRGEDPLLLVKMAIFFAAAVVATIGMATERPRVIFAGIVMLGVGFLLRFLRPREDDARLDEDTPVEDDPAEGSNEDGDEPSPP